MAEHPILEAMAQGVREHVTIGGDSFATAMADSLYVDQFALDAPQAKAMVEQMSKLAALAALRKLAEAEPTRHMVWAGQNAMRVDDLDPTTDEVAVGIKAALRALLEEVEAAHG